VPLTFSVCDSGIGMRPSQRTRVFTPFAQGDATTHLRYGGTGLGLSIAERLVAAMGGTIEVESAPGLGSTFRFSVALEEAARPASAGATQRTSGALANLAAEHPLRVLVADDNAVNQLVARRLFARLGYTVDVVANGAEAVTAVERQRYDVVFMDLEMPVMDGLTATREIVRRWPTGERPRIVALTASALDADRRAAEEAGVDDFMSKPVTLERIAAAVRACATIAHDA
jgi:CheY-like chemotaxis protein